MDAVLNFLQSGLDTLNQIPSTVWASVIEIIFSAFVASPVAFAIKKWWQHRGKRVTELGMLGVVLFGSVFTTALFYLKDDPGFGPWIILVQGALAFATTQPVYFTFVKPLSIKIARWFATAMEQAQVINEVKTAAVPPSGIPAPQSTPTISVDTIDNQEFTR